MLFSSYPGTRGTGCRFAAIGVLLSPAILLAQPAQVRVGAGHSVPWAYTGTDGKPAGFYYDVLKEAARRENLEFVFTFRADTPEKALQSGQIDLWAAAVPTETRRKILYFSRPWWSQDHYLGVIHSGPVYGPSDLDGKKVAYSDRPPFTTPLSEALPGASLLQLRSLTQRFLALCDGRADAVLFYNESSFYSVAASEELAACRERGLRLIKMERPIMEVAIASRHQDSQLADRIRLRIDEMTADHTIAKFASSPVTGTHKLAEMLQAEKTRYNQTILELTTAFLAAVVVLAAVAIYRLRRANRRTQAALALAEKASRVKGEFLATMSHEIRTPLTAVVGYLDMLAATPLRQEQRRFAAEAAQAAGALLTQIKTVFEYARPENPNKPALANQTLDPAAVADDCLAAVLLEAQTKGLTLTVEIDPSVPSRLSGDDGRLRQALLNLLSNAVKFTARGSVRLSVSYTNGSLVAVVADTGIGVPAEKRTLIFEPFTQLDSSDKRRFGGMGVGLAVVADICRQQGGEVSVADEPGGGARFTLRLPFPSIPGEPAWFGPPCDGAAVLLAPQSPAIAVLARYLSNAGLSVTRLETEASLDNWTPPASGRILCFLHSPGFLDTNPVWRNHRTTIILMGDVHALSGLAARRHAFDDALSLPVAARAVRDLLRPAPVPAESAPTPAPNPRRVLVVDDNAVNRRVLSSLLEKLGCHVDTASDGQEAVEAAMRQRYSAILMDCQMPVMNGYEAAEEIRRNVFQTGDVPICGVSASVDDETRAHCKASGMTGYLPKPVTLAALRDALSSMTADR